jgi:hypothetical protein
MLRSAGETLVGLLYCLIDEGATLRGELGLPTLKIHMGIVECLWGIVSLSCLLTQAVLSRMQRQVQQILK